MKKQRNAGFTLVELLVVIGIIAVLISILMPTMAKARRHAQMVKCQSNLRQIGLALEIYANRSKGWLFPPNLGSGTPHEQRWPTLVLSPPVWNSPILICPTDFEPAEEHSYIFNDHVWYDHSIKRGSRDLGGITSSEFILMGEKKTSVPDYYAGKGPLYYGPDDVENLWEGFRHGIRIGSNYLFLDSHVEAMLPQKADRGIDPWSYQAPTTAP